MFKIYLSRTVSPGVGISLPATIEDVYKRQLVKVAQKYNLHYGRLISSLKQANVPYPPSGYWTSCLLYTSRCV